MTDVDPLPGVPVRTKRHVEAILAAAERYELDPLLIAAIIDHESGGGKFLDKHHKGDGGHGHGLMQIDDRYHLPFIHYHDWKNPITNIDYGTALLKQYIQQCGGAEDAGVAAYNAGPGKVRRVLRLLKPNATPEERLRALNSVTTHKKYVTHIYSRLERWRKLRGADNDGDGMVV